MTRWQEINVNLTVKSSGQRYISQTVELLMLEVILCISFEINECLSVLQTSSVDRVW